MRRKLAGVLRRMADRVDPSPFPGIKRTVRYFQGSILGDVLEPFNPPGPNV